MRAAALLILGWLLIGMQSSTLHALPGMPDFLVPLSLYLGFSREVLRAAVLAGVLGYFADVLGGQPAGLHVVTAMLLSMAASLLSTRLFLRGVVFASVLTALGSALSQAVAIALLAAFYRGFEGSELLYGRFLPELLATTLVGGLVFGACARIDALGRKVDTRKFGTEGEEEE